jgi:uncharacterized protein
VSRVPLRIVRSEPEARMVECTECGKCCTYVGVGVNTPTTPRYATDILWYLYHEKVYVYVDGDGEWSVHFETRCRNLGPDLLCGVYEDRPHICRAFDNKTCEVNDREHESITFREPAEFLTWLRAKKPRLYARIEDRFIPASLRPARAGRARSQARVRRTEAR